MEFTNKISGFVASLLSPMADFSNVILFLSLIVFVIVAIFSLKLFNLEMTVAGAVSGFLLGSIFVPSMFGGLFEVLEISKSLSIPSLIGFGFAILFAFLAHLLKRFAMFVCGIAFGALLGYVLAKFLEVVFFDLKFFTSPWGFWTIVVLCSLIVATLMIAFFSQLFIVFTVLGSGAGFGISTFMLVTPLGAVGVAPIVSLSVCGALALALTIFGLIYQFKTNTFEKKE